MTLESLGFAVTEQLGTPRSLVLSGARPGSPAAAAGARAGDLVLAVCGTTTAELGARLDDEFLDKHALDALTVKADERLRDAPTVALKVLRRTARRVARQHLDARRRRRPRSFRWARGTWGPGSGRTRPRCGA